MIETKKELKIEFIRADEGPHTMTIPDYKPGVTMTEAKAAGQVLIDQDAFEPDGYALVGIKRIYTVDTTTNEFDLTEAEA